MTILTIHYKCRNCRHILFYNTNKIIAINIHHNTLLYNNTDQSIPLHGRIIYCRGCRRLLGCQLEENLLGFYCDKIVRIATTE